MSAEIITPELRAVGELSAQTEPQRGALETAKNVAAALVTSPDLPGINEPLRLGLIAGVELATHNPTATTAVVTAATFAIETAAAVGISRLLATERGGRIMNRIGKALGKIGLKGERETSVITDSALAFTAGVAIMTANKQRTNPARTFQQNSRYGLRVAAGISAASAPLTYLAAETMNANSLPEKIAAGTLAVAGLVGASRWASSRLKNKTAVVNTVEAEATEPIPVEARYDLDDEALALAEKTIVGRVREKYGSTMCAVWVDGRSEEANFMRTHEARVFPDIDVQSLFGPYDDSSAFLAMVDTRPSAGEGRVIRGTRVTGTSIGTRVADELTQRSGEGMAMLRDMIDDGEVTANELRQYYDERGVDLAKCIAVETNFRIGDRAKRWLGIVPAADAAYFAMYDFVMRGADPSKSRDRMIFAHINAASVASLGRIGVDVEHVAGRDDLQTPAGPGSETRYDNKFKPVALPNSPRTAKIMHRLRRFAPAVLYL